MINNIIFSKDRACQLRLLLESIKKNADNIFNVNIIYKASNEEFNKGYEQLKAEELLPNINWVKQSLNFKKDVISILDSNYEYSCFATDDDIIYRKVDEGKIIKAFKEDKDIFCFSLRLGKNVTVCYSMNSKNKIVPFEDEEEVIKWEWKKHYYDAGYSLSVDYHVFTTKDINKLVNKITFENPNTLEANLQIFSNFPKQIMAAFEQSVVVNTPINIVNEVYNNRQGEQFAVSVEEFNKRYLDGEVIDLEKIDFSNIIGCHQELYLPFKNKQ
jgi:hypothetical protein